MQLRATSFRIFGKGMILTYVPLEFSPLKNLHLQIICMSQGWYENTFKKIRPSREMLGPNLKSASSVPNFY